VQRHPVSLTAYTQSAQNFTQNMVSWVSKVATLAAVATALHILSEILC
jgi:ATP-binding cassette subfamily B protein